MRRDIEGAGALLGRAAAMRGFRLIMVVVCFTLLY
jgi:hypothetical protein